MAYDEGQAEMLREMLADLPGITEQRMFGGLCFLLDGHIVCGVGPKGALFRLGPEAALAAAEGIGPMVMGGRTMRGFFRASDEAMADDALRDRLVRASLAVARALPAK